MWDELADGAPIVEFTKEDVLQLWRRGYSAPGPIVDLMVAAWVLDENQKLSLEAIAKKYCRIEMDKRLVRIGGKAMFRCDSGALVPIHEAPRSQLRAYCKRDVEAEIRVLWALIQLLEEEDLLEYFFEEEVPFTRVLAEMEMAGMPVDLGASERLRKKTEAEHSRLGAVLMEGLPDVFNLGSDQHVADYVFSKTVRIRGRIPVPDVPEVPEGFHPDWSKIGRLWLKGEWRFPGLGLPRGTVTETGKPSVSKTALRMNPHTRDHPWVRMYLEYQKLDTILTVFLRKFPEVARADADGRPRIYCHFNQTGTRTGRLSSSNPNMQNVPARGSLGKAIRSLFRVPDDDFPFLMGDHAQLETRLMAHFSGDPTLVEIFRAGRDPFVELASRIYGKTVGKDDDERAVTKNVWYAQGYGAMAYKISEMLTMEGFPTSESEADDLLTELSSVLPVYFEWREDLIEYARAHGYVETIGGRRRRIALGGDTSWKATSHGERAAANAKVQGSAADIVRRTMLRFRRSWLRLLLQVHDELVYQYAVRTYPLGKERDVVALREIAEVGHGYDLAVPLVFDARVALSWAEKG